MKLKLGNFLSLMSAIILLSTRAASGASTASLVASPFQKPGPGGDVVVAATLSPADGVTSAEFSYRYDPAVLTPTGVFRTGYTNGFSIRSDISMRGIVEVQLTGSTPLAGSGDLAWVEFHIRSAAATTTSVSWVSLTLNGGTIPSQTRSSNLVVSSAPVTISAPATATAAPQAQVVVPISATAFSGASSFDLSLSFNSAVLTPVSVQTTTLTSCMSAVSNLAIPGTVNLALYGLCSVSGSGQIAKVTFKVKGALGSKTPLNVTRGAINEEHIATVLQDGLFFSCDSIDHDGDGYSSCGGDCDDANGMVHPGAAETCNAIDDDCDGLVDNVALPQGISALAIAKAADDAQLSWPAAAGATRYDVVGGDLAKLVATHGDFSAATDLCLANDSAATAAHDPTIPAAGNGQWYLVRGENCGGFGSFDSGEAGIANPRDLLIAASPSRCP